MSEPKEIFVRTDRCMSCHSCEMACAIAHSNGKNLYTALFETPQPKSRIYVEWLVPDKAVPIVCRHCEEAPCLHACIAGAIHREANGVVITDKDKCIGCWTCVMVCPYGVIGRHLEEQKAYRCDRCPDLVTPACVDGCPTGALVYQSVSEYAGATRKKSAKVLLVEQGG
jgi:anaerobic carbon-monoxide dehydrogenase iron sulfur subunit